MSEIVRKKGNVLLQMMVNLLDNLIPLSLDLHNTSRANDYNSYVKVLQLLWPYMCIHGKVNYRRVVLRQLVMFKALENLNVESWILKQFKTSLDKKSGLPIELFHGSITAMEKAKGFKLDASEVEKVAKLISSFTQLKMTNGENLSDLIDLSRHQRYNTSNRAVSSPGNQDAIERTGQYLQFLLADFFEVSEFKLAFSWEYGNKLIYLTNSQNFSVIPLHMLPWNASHLHFNLKCNQCNKWVKFEDIEIFACQHMICSIRSSEKLDCRKITPVYISMEGPSDVENHVKQDECCSVCKKGKTEKIARVDNVVLDFEWRCSNENCAIIGRPRAIKSCYVHKYHQECIEGVDTCPECKLALESAIEGVHKSQADILMNYEVKKSSYD